MRYNPQPSIGSSTALYAQHPSDLGKPGKKSITIVAPGVGGTKFKEAYSVEEVVRYCTATVTALLRKHHQDSYRLTSPHTHTT